jgi:hypothetical protein
MSHSIVVIDKAIDAAIRIESTDWRDRLPASLEAPVGNIDVNTDFGRVLVHRLKIGS